MLTETNAGDIVPVPLIVKWPAGQQAPRGLDDRNVQTIDILPTIADAVGLTLPIDVDGVSALGRGRVDDGKRVYFSQATKVRYFSSDETWHLVLEAARRQRAIFGADRWPSPRLAGFEHLVGQPIEGLTVEGEAGIRPKIARPLAFENIDPTSPTLPVQVVGTIEPPSRPPPGALGVAVAINGTIAATSQTRPGSGQWFALVPPSALRPGPNAVSVYLLDPAHPDWLLAPRTPDGPRVSNLMLPEATAWGVRQEGLYRLEGDASHPFRWTDGKASIDVPIDPAHQPTELSIAAAVTGSSVGRLRVLVDGCEALTTEAPDGWSERVALGRCAPPGYWAHVEILSGTHVTGHGDRRELGIALSRLTLD
jgi:hypothetical protein